MSGVSHHAKKRLRELEARGPVEWLVLAEGRGGGPVAVEALTAAEAVLWYASSEFLDSDDDEVVRVHVGGQVFEVTTEVRRERTVAEVTK